MVQMRGYLILKELNYTIVVCQQNLTDKTILLIKQTSISPKNTSRAITPVK